MQGGKGTVDSRGSGTGRLVLNLKDLNGLPVAGKSRITVRSLARHGESYSATGKSRELTRYVFQLPSGQYSVCSSCVGLQDGCLLVSIPSCGDVEHDVILTCRDRCCKRGRAQGEAKMIDDRSEGIVCRRVARRIECPSGARVRELARKAHTPGAEMINAPGLHVQRIEDPLPNSSFGSVGSYVRVGYVTHAPRSGRALLMIPYAPEKLGWVDPATLRVFAVDPDKHQFQLIDESGACVERNCAYAYIDRPGIYGVIGLPSSQSVLETVGLITRLHPWAGESGSGSLQDRICQLILCARHALLGSDEQLTPPGGVEGDACDFCRGLDIPPDGLPEAQILDGPWPFTLLQGLPASSILAPRR